MHSTIASRVVWGAIIVAPDSGGTVQRSHHRAAACCGVALLLAATTAAQAQSTSLVYWISMRVFATDPGPIYVVASSVQSDQQSAAVQACDGNTYYLAPADLATLENELQNQGVVQLNAGPQGSTPDVSGVVCLIQAPQ